MIKVPLRKIGRVAKKPEDLFGVISSLSSRYISLRPVIGRICGADIGQTCLCVCWRTDSWRWLKVSMSILVISSFVLKMCTRALSCLAGFLGWSVFLKAVRLRLWVEIEISRFLVANKGGRTAGLEPFMASRCC